MDAETDQHIEESRRPPEQKPLRKGVGGSGGLVAEYDLSSDIFDPAVKLHDLREKRMRERLVEKLDRMVPVERVELKDVTIPEALGDGEEREIEHYSGPAFRIRTNCIHCKVEILLDSLEEPGLHARAVVAGVLRRRPGSFICDECAAEREAAEERIKTEEAHRERVGNSRLDKSMQGFEFGQMRVTNGRGLTVFAARDWATEEKPDPKRGLCIFGSKGAGKTRLAATAVWQRLRNWPITWVSWPVLQAQLGAAFNDSARAAAISALTGKGALAIDDIAQEPDEKVSDYLRRQLFAAIDGRIQAGAPLLITTNLAPSQVGDVLGEKLMSRIVGYCRVLELPGEDMRLEFTFDGSETLEQAKKRAAEEAAAKEGLVDPEEDGSE